MISQKSREVRRFIDIMRGALGLGPLYGDGNRGQRYRVWPAHREHQDNNYMTVRYRDTSK